MREIAAQGGGGVGCGKVDAPAPRETDFPNEFSVPLLPRGNYFEPVIAWCKISATSG